MADKSSAKTKLNKLAGRIKGIDTSYSEYLKLVQAVDAGKIKNRTELTQVLGESLNRSTSEIQTALASDDGDRLADEIVSLLKD